MKTVVAMVAIIIHVLLDTDHSMRTRYTALAKCVVVSPQQQGNQQADLSEKARNETIDERKANESTTRSTTTTPCYHHCDHGRLRHDQYEDQYKVIATILNAEDKNILANTVDSQKRWRKVVIEAMELQQARRYKQSFSLHRKPIHENDDNQSVNVQIVKTQCSIRTCTEIFVVLYNNRPIPAEIVVSDLSLLSLSRISARLGIPVESITTLLPVGSAKSQWWIVAVVIGVAASIIAVGWLCLFVYYNSCGRPYSVAAEKPIIHTNFLHDKFIQTGESDNGSKYFDVQSQDAKSDKKKSPLKTIYSGSDSLSRMQKAMEDASVKDVAKEAAVGAVPATSATDQYVTTVHTDHQQQFDYPISIITRPRKKDLRIHKLQSSSDILVPSLKEICIEEKLHPHPIPPTISGILEVKSLAEEMYRNPMNCL
ncbi:unnamed protein product [Litomosoides sigmodontis]|uniref:Uncharacterized protein n=1 Tax=Litomosoides sigmodontis TaxID=42156 RepID=A0A3P6T274_LITSI|nr:unnamed protein product [Litomosoides sigmodontis]